MRSAALAGVILGGPAAVLLLRGSKRVRHLVAERSLFFFERPVIQVVDAARNANHPGIAELICVADAVHPAVPRFLDQRLRVHADSVTICNDCNPKVAASWFVMLAKSRPLDLECGIFLGAWNCDR